MGGTGFLACAYGGGGTALPAQIADSPTIETANALDVRMRFSVNPHNFIRAGALTPLFGKYNSTGNQRSWQLLYYGGYFTSYMSTNGIGATLTDLYALVGTPPPDLWIRMTWRGSDGRSRLYINPDANDMPTSWVQAGADTTGLVGSLYDASSVLGIGNSVAGSAQRIAAVRRFQLWNGIEGAGGTKVVDADFTKQPDGTTQFVEDASGLTVTVNGSARICNRVGA